MPTNKSQVLGNRNRKPPCQVFDPKSVPAKLKKYARWIGWQWVFNSKSNGGKGKWNKPPKDARTGGPASSTDPSTWCTFEDAVSGLNVGHVDGIGFVLGDCGDGTHISGIDLDDCRDPDTGRLNALAKTIVTKMETYAEVSPSKTGVKLLCEGRLPSESKTSNKANTIEIYQTKRYFAITGRRLPGKRRDVEKRQRKLSELYEKHIASEQKLSRSPVSKSVADAPVNRALPAAVRAIYAIQPSGGESDGSERLMRIAKQVVCHDLSDDLAIKLIRGYENTYPFPKHYSDEELRSRIRDAEGRNKRGSRQSRATNTQSYVPFPTCALPKSLRDLVESGAQAIGCDPAFIAVSALVVCAAAIGDSRVVQIKRSWKEPSILWAAIVGSSGAGKSPGIELALAPTHAIQQLALDEFKAEMEVYKEALKEHKRLSSKSSDNNSEEPVKPIARRYIVNDVTMEAMAPLLENSSRGLLLCRDELSGWVASFDRYTRGGGGTSADAAHWLSIHGARPTIVDRKTGDKQTIHLASPRVSVIGGIQPGILKKALGSEHLENGLAARLLNVFPPTRPKQWTDAEVSSKVEEAYSETVTRLYQLKSTKGDDGSYEPVALQLSGSAKQLFISFYNSHSKEAARESDDLAAAYWKLEGYAARLALILYCVRKVTGETDTFKIDEVSMRNALELIAWFKQEARRVYSMIQSDEDELAQQRLLDFISVRGGAMTCRELQQGNRRFKTSDDAEEALNELATMGLGEWVERKSTEKGGRPTRVFKLTCASTST